MLKSIRKLLNGKQDVAALESGIESIDLAALQAAVTEAQQRRAAILLDGTVDDILAAERLVDEARIELERGQVALSELERRKAQAEADAQAAMRKAERDAAQAKVEAAIKLLNTKAMAAALTVAEALRVVDEAEKARADAEDNTLRDFKKDVISDEEVFAFRLPSVKEWLEGEESNRMPEWCRGLLYQRVQAHLYL